MTRALAVFNKLYLRIWLAVVMAVAVLTLLVGWVWHLAAEPPLRDVVVRDDTGQVIGRGQTRGPLTEEEIRERRALRRALRHDAAQVPAAPPMAPPSGGSPGR